MWSETIHSITKRQNHVPRSITFSKGIGWQLLSYRLNLLITFLLCKYFWRFVTRVDGRKSQSLYITYNVKSKIIKNLTFPCPIFLILLIFIPYPTPGWPPISPEHSYPIQAPSTNFPTPSNSASSLPSLKPRFPLLPLPWW